MGARLGEEVLQALCEQETLPYPPPLGQEVPPQEALPPSPQGLQALPPREALPPPTCVRQEVPTQEGVQTPTRTVQQMQPDQALLPPKESGLQQALPPCRHQGEEVHWQEQELQKSAQMGPPLQPQDGVPYFQE